MSCGITSETAVGAYAAALSTVGLVAVLATATNRAYARRLAILLEQWQYATLLVLRRKRLRWLLPVVAQFLIGCLVVAREVLGFFRPEFVDEGVVPLRLLAVITTAVTVLFALAPTYLKYRSRNRATFVTIRPGSTMAMYWSAVTTLVASTAQTSEATICDPTSVVVVWITGRQRPRNARLCNRATCCSIRSRSRTSSMRDLGSMGYECLPELPANRTGKTSEDTTT